ncbi:transmembrane protein 39A [Trichogramma pretiosum]|uniref:transmembrane protein 39A n=1 Tax=Trichogramma pretiosum TaxID=7493 RepID=UPI0006C9AA9B|nr:transmembrane protein 39A [Trichogramma pretiosum]
MAGGRRCPAGKGSTSSRIQTVTAASNANAASASPANNYNNTPPNYNSSPNSTFSTGLDDGKNMSEQLPYNKVIIPKHIPIPARSGDGLQHYEAYILVTCLIAASLQLLNLYKTVWWFSESHNDYSVNFYLLDFYLLTFITIMVSRQFIYAMICKSFQRVIPNKWLPFALKVMRIVLLAVIMSALFWCLYHMKKRHNINKIFYLCYPILIYFLMFGISIEPFFDLSTVQVYLKEDKKTKFYLDKPMHNCSSNAVTIRQEVASLKSDFNSRLKRALYAASGSAYLCGIAPVIFVPQHLHYNIYWVVQHTVFIWLGQLGANFAQSYSFRYCDVLHKSAAHLGKWSKVNSKGIQASHTWDDKVLWPHGTLVRHNKEVYRSEGLCTAAEPGNSSHSRFYTLFGEPTTLLLSLVGWQMTVVGIQFLISIRKNEWYQVISNSLLLASNCYPLYTLMRDYILCCRVHRVEQMAKDKPLMAQSNCS